MADNLGRNMETVANENVLRRVAETVWLDAEVKHNGATTLKAQRRRD